MFRLFRYLKPYKFSIILVLLFTFLQAILELYLPTLMSNIVDIGIVEGDINYIWKTGGLMLIMALGATISIIFASYLSAKISSGFSRILRKEVFTRVESFSLREFDTIGTSSLINRTTNDITQIERVTIMMLRMMLRAPMMLIGGIIMAASKDLKLSSLIVGIVVVLAGIIYIITKRTMPLFKVMQKKLDRLNLVVREGLTGIRVIRAFNRKEYEKKRFNHANVDLRDTSIRVNKMMASLMPAMLFITNITTIAIVWFGGARINSGAMQVGDLMAFIQYMMQIMFSLMMLSMIFVMIPRASASVDRINEVLDVVPEMKDGEDKEVDNKKSGYIEFKNVTFSYPGAEKPVIEDISFQAGPGEVTAIIGGTGSGKSTLIKLIPRFYDVNKGSILIDGVDIRDMTQKELRDKIGFTPQKSVLFSGTIAENIRYGKEDATFEEVEHAAEVAQATEFISHMEDGFESIIAQGGNNLSGGQKQRLAIARALVRKPEIYVFDDSFSALDAKTDVKLREALKEETTKSTMIVVAQRVSTIMDAHKIIVLDEGKIAGIGTHGELIKNCEAYGEIIASQFSEEELA